MPEKKKIMVVEDDSFVMDIYHTKLTQEGFEVITATNGVEAIKKIAEGVKPDLMLLDIVMPYKDGLEVLRDIREKKQLEGVPIVLLTNLSQKEEIDEGFRLGVVDYLIKSHFTPSEVLEKVSKYIK